MSKAAVHFEALGYEPFRMKPVHFAAGFFLSIAGDAPCASTASSDARECAGGALPFFFRAI